MNRTCYYYTFTNRFGDTESVGFDSHHSAEKARKLTRRSDKSVVKIVVVPDYTIELDGEKYLVSEIDNGQKFVYEFRCQYDKDGRASIHNSSKTQECIQMWEYMDNGELRQPFSIRAYVPAWFNFVLQDVSKV